MPSEKKRILIFIDWFSPGYKAGGPISSNANLIDHLHEQIEFFVITRNTDYCESQPYSNVKSDEWNTLPNGAHVYYISKKKLSFTQLIKIIKSISFDTVFVNGIYSLYFSLFPLIWFKYFSKIPLIISARGMLSEQTFSSKKLKKKIYYTLARIFHIYNGVIIHATNEQEQSQIHQNLHFKGEIRIASNLPPKAHYTLNSISKNPGELRLVSIARISPEKNTLFALNMMKELVKATEKPVIADQFIFDLFGTIYDQAYWNECNEVLEFLKPWIKVSWLGPIEREKVHETMQNYHFLFMPSQGENFGHSIIESLLAGRPVIISDRTPWKHLQSPHLEIPNPKLQIPYFAAGTNLNFSLAQQKSEIENLKSEIENLKSEISFPVGWDLPLEEPTQFVKVIEFCARMSQEDFNQMSQNAYNFANKIVEDPAILEANRKLFEN